MKKTLIVCCIFSVFILHADGEKQAAVKTDSLRQKSASGEGRGGSGMDQGRVLTEPGIWFPMVEPTRISAGSVSKSDTRGLLPLPCQTITKQDAAHSSLAWSGLNLPLPADRVLHVPIYLDDFQAGGYSPSLSIQLTNAGGEIRYSFSANSFKAAGWSFIPLWDPSTPADAVFSKIGTSWIVEEKGFDFTKPVRSISIVPDNLPAGAKISIASIETAAKTKPVIVVTVDICDDSTFQYIVPIMEAAGFRGGLRIGGSKERSYSEDRMAKLRKAYDNGWDVYNGSWSRCGFNDASTPELLEREILECRKRAEVLGFTRGMTWFSAAGNVLPSQSVCRTVGSRLGMKAFKDGGGIGRVNIIRSDGVDDPAILTCTGMGGSWIRPASGVCGESTIAMPNVRSLREGSAVSGTGIGVGARIAPHGVHGNTVVLTVRNTDDIAGPVTLSDSLEVHMAFADGLLFTGGALVYFMHDVRKSSEPPTSLSFPVEDFTRLVAYWKAKSDLGLLDVVTPSRFDAIMRSEH
ncbi:MAG: hypothetical protein WAX69_09720 [Victivallales bacterium]